MLYRGLADLPHFNPDDDTDPLPAPVAALRAAIAEADALLICTPEYAGTLPGLVQEPAGLDGRRHRDLRQADRLGERRRPRSRQGAEATLRAVLGYTGAAVVDAACVRIPVGSAMAGADGTVADPEMRRRLADVLAPAGGRREERGSGGLAVAVVSPRGLRHAVRQDRPSSAAGALRVPARTVGAGRAHGIGVVGSAGGQARSRSSLTGTPNTGLTAPGRSRALTHIGSFLPGW